MSWRLERSCVEYERGWDPAEEYKTVKLRQRFADGTTDEAKVPTDDGTKGIEYLVLVVVQEFMEAAAELEFQDEELFTNFAKILRGNTKQKWLTIINGVDIQDEATFREALQELYVSIVGPNQCNMVKHWLESQCRKPMGVTPLEHLSRIQELVRFANAMEGTETEIDTEKEKEIFFSTCPRPWQEYYIRSARRLQNDTIAEVGQYMNILYGLEANRPRQDGNKRRDNSNENGGGRGSNKRQRPNQRGRGDDRGGRSKDKAKIKDRIAEGSITMIPVHCILMFTLFTPGGCVDRTSTVPIFNRGVIAVKKAVVVGAVAVVLEAV